MTSSTPLVSIVLSVRNGLPYVRDAVESVRALTYANYELVVQDGQSTDGTLEYLRSVEGIRRLSVVSEPDGGPVEGFNRGLKRCQGEIIASVDSDNRLRPDSLETVVGEFRKQPDAAVIYGACNVIAQDGSFIHLWTAPDFDLLSVLDCTVVPPFASSFFMRDRCDGALWVEETFEISGDYDLWLRLSHLKIVRIFDILADVRVGLQSSTSRASSYDKQVYYKTLGATRFLAGPHRDRAVDALQTRATAGINLWAVDSMHMIDGPQEDVDRFFASAVRADIPSERYRDVVTRARPRIRQLDAALAQELFACGAEFLQRGRAADALVYFELLERSDYRTPELVTLLERSRTEAFSLQAEVNRRDALLESVQAALQEQLQVVGSLQLEVNQRDTLLAELQSTLQTECDLRDRMLVEQQAERVEAVAIRDQIIDELRAEFEKPWHKFGRWMARRGR